MRTAARPPRPPRSAAPPARKGRLVRGARIRLVVSTAPAKQAARLAKRLLDARVAACVSIVSGVASTYRWKGRVERAREALLLIKTTAALLQRCVSVLAAEHPYEVPEILVGAPGRVASAYAEWIQAETA